MSIDAIGYVNAGPYSTINAPRIVHFYAVTKQPRYITLISFVESICVLSELLSKLTSYVHYSKIYSRLHA